MTSAAPKRASWRLKLALVLAGVAGFAGGGLAALEKVTRKERELAAVRRARGAAAETAAMLEVRGSNASLDAAVARLEAGVIDSQTLARVSFPGLREIAVVRFGPWPSPAAPVTVLWARDLSGELAAFLAKNDPLVQGLALRVHASHVAYLLESVGVRSEDGRVSVPAFLALEVRGPAPMELVLRVEVSAAVTPLLPWLRWRLFANHDAE